jgi:UDP-2-acetamido-2,6-beta-L-arabino-hexul-4-ose reductase
MHIPKVADPFTRKLFSTYLSYLPEKDRALRPIMHHDSRGWLFEFMRSKEAGQIFVSTTQPGITRENHYHHTKVEKFCLVNGCGRIDFRQTDSADVASIYLDDKEIRVVDIPPGFTHAITNVGEDEMIVIFWANEIFDPAIPDTYALKVCL